MADEHVFRFLAVRPATATPESERVDKKVPVVNPGDRGEFVQTLLRLSQSANTTRETYAAAARQFKATPAYVKRGEQLPFDLTPLQDWALTNASTPLATLDLSSEIRRLYDQDAASLAGTPEFKETARALADTLLADSITKEGAERAFDANALSFKLLHLIRQIAADAVPSHGTLGSLIANYTLVLPDLANLNKYAGQEPDDKPEDRPDPEREKKDRLKAKLKDLEDARRELTRLASDRRKLGKPAKEDQANTRLDAMEKRLTEFTARLAAQPNDPNAARRPGDSTIGSINTARRKFVLSPEAVKNMSATSQRVLRDLDLDLDALNPINTVGALEREMQYTAMELTSDEAHTRMLSIGGVFLDASKFKASLGFLQPDRLIDVLRMRCQFMTGIGDLLIVRQKLKAYELADFAHVENVLAGESREREHRRLNLTEEISVVETENETQKERDLQSTERNEIQSEAEKTVKSQLQLEAGLQVSGSYGPSVSFSSSLNVGYSTTVEETQRKSASYSREVIEKSAERVRERVREERRRRTLEQIEEINKHKVDNSNAANGHVRGIYRWLNKIYDAQVFNYGQRMMYEFVIPEPAAYFLYALVENPPKEIELIKPEPPTYYGQPLKPENLTRHNYQSLVSRYQVLNAPEPPSSFVMVSYQEKAEGTEEAQFARSSKVVIPEGYEAFGATVSTAATNFEGHDSDFLVMIGGQAFGRNYVSSDFVPFDDDYRGELSVSVIMYNKLSFVFSADVFCKLTDEGWAKWQHNVYEAIMQAYLQQKADYEEKLAAAEIQKGIQVLGRNPLENRRLERDELKKLVIMMLTGKVDTALDSYYSTAEPQMRIWKACANGSYIRFFENAFEWHNMLYVLYPYFWGRHARWISALHLTDPDPDFAAFLKAGAARVQVPVRPGFERAVAHFSQYGEIWEGNDIPLRDDELYVPIVDEITENLGRLDDGVPYPEGSSPWEVTVPTSLVVVQDLEEIPGIRDVLTGSVIDLENEMAPA